MNIEWTKKDVPLTPPMIERVAERAASIQSRFPDETFHLTVSLVQNKGTGKPYSYRLKGILTHDNLLIKAESRQLDYYDAVDDMMDTLLSNIKKALDKKEKHTRDLKRLLKEDLKPVYDDVSCEEDFEADEVRYAQR